MSINLELFCSTAGARPLLARPFTQGEFTFATNGHVAVRVPRIPRVRRRNGTPDAEKVFERLFKPQGRFKALPPLALASEPCPLCVDGHDELGICDTCYGSSRVFPTVLLGNWIFDGRYIALIQDNLLNARLALKGKKNDAASFRFDGGDGLLMPRNTPVPETPVIKAAYERAKPQAIQPQ